MGPPCFFSTCRRQRSRPHPCAPLFLAGASFSSPPCSSSPSHFTSTSSVEVRRGQPSKFSSPPPLPSPPDWGGVGGGAAQSRRLALDVLLEPPRPPLPPLLLPPPCLGGAAYI